jgi:ADP-ribose pyrophosphatase YjhB (NUDIX family)
MQLDLTHHLQRQIIERLTYADSLRFSDLKPAELESNIFMYHIRQLQKLGLVDKDETGKYKLSIAGLTYVDSISFTSLKVRKQPKLISILAVKNQRGEWLLAKRKIQPYIGEYMFVSGKQHFGESSKDHAARELHEKTGMQIPLELRGFIDIQISSSEGTLMTHILGGVYVGTCENNGFPQDTPKFAFEWVKDLENVKDKLMPGTYKITELLASRDDLFYEQITE